MRLRQRLRSVLRAPWMPVAGLVVVSVLSLTARAAWLSDPCANPCRGPAAHSLIFDEVYYVNAARRIDGIAVPGNQSYAGTPAGQDPNSEHPQFAKLVISGAIGAGKRVLFVSEKMAALDVVKRRMDRVGLGAECLELHSNRTNKKN